ncbi:unnamed protein product, partial [Mesorhabditis spiculigera]
MEKGYTCQICSLAAPGSHFSVISCRACAAFFRRTAFLKISYVCQGTQQCDVTKKKRFSCRSCRYQKCWDLGMRPSMIKQLVEDEQEQKPTTNLRSEISTPPSSSSQHTDPEQIPESDDAEPATGPSIDGGLVPASVIKDMLEQQQQVKDKVEGMFATMNPISKLAVPIRLSIMQRGLLLFNEHLQKWPLCTPEKVRPGEPFTIAEIIGNHRQELENVSVFCMGFEDFARLEQDQKWVLFKRFWNHFTALERHRTAVHCFKDPPVTRMLLYNGTYYDFEDQRHWTRRSSNLKKIIDFASPMIKKELNQVVGLLRRTAPTDFELVFCMLHILWNTANVSKLTETTIKMAEDVRKRLSTEIHEYYTTEMHHPNYAGRLMKVMKLVAAFNEAEHQRGECRTALRTFEFLPSEYMNTDFVDE